ERLYRTGDRVRLEENGSLTFLGRLDRQVKLRGFRIEPGETEAALAAQPGVARALAEVRGDARGERRLFAWVVPAAEATLDGAALRDALRRHLPDHLVPSAVAAIAAVPLTANGKVDRAALAALEVGEAESAAGYVAPRTEAERALAEIFAEVLGVERVGVEEDFFALGGDSILSLQITSRAQRAGLQVTPRQVFEHPTVAALARVAGTVKVDAEQGPVTGEAPLLPIQRWFLEAGLESRHHTNLPLLLEPQAPLAPLQPEPLAAALGWLVRHHDALRAGFHDTVEGWRQVIEPPAEAGTPFPLAHHDLSELAPEGQDEALRQLGTELQGSFRIEAAPLLTAALFELGEERGQRLLLVSHHLVTDNVSWQVLVEDLAQAYLALAAGKAPQLPPKTTSFARWGERLAERAASEALAAEAAYWSAPARRRVPSLPVDHPRGENLEASAEVVAVELGVDDSAFLQGGALIPYRSRVEELLLAALSQALSRWTGEPRVLVDLEGHGREDLFEDVDLSRTVGWFSTLYPLLLDLESA
ncbi:MAG: non-ribosomal peptide synthetase, partial [Acidobacteria bacterium]|nr:non-ribosomal peptide synthetase [Acidobacteriota bacterium]